MLILTCRRLCRRRTVNDSGRSADNAATLRQKPKDTPPKNDIRDGSDNAFEVRRTESSQKAAKKGSSSSVGRSAAVSVAASAASTHEAEAVEEANPFSTFVEAKRKRQAELREDIVVLRKRLEVLESSFADTSEKAAAALPASTAAEAPANGAQRPTPKARAAASSSERPQPISVEGSSSSQGPPPEGVVLLATMAGESVIHTPPPQKTEPTRLVRTASPHRARFGRSGSASASADDEHTPLPERALRFDTSLRKLSPDHATTTTAAAAAMTPELRKAQLERISKLSRPLSRKLKGTTHEEPRSFVTLQVGWYAFGNKDQHSL